MKFRWLLLAAFFLPQHSYAFICGLGTCTQQCTSPDSVIGEQPLPNLPDLNNGNYVDCLFACIDIKEQFACSDGTPIPWLAGDGNNLQNPDTASVLLYQNGSFRAYVDPSFTPIDRELIKESLEIVVEQLGVLFLSDPMNSEFGKCTAPLGYERYQMADFWGANFWDKNTYGHANIWRRAREDKWPYIPGAPGIKYDLRIVKLWEDGAFGKAAVGEASVTRPVIGLNWDNLKGYRKVKGELQKYTKYSQPAFWASVITHEILHTTGFVHPEVNWEDPASAQKYQNTFMVYFADCVTKVASPETYDPYSKLGMQE